MSTHNVLLITGGEHHDFSAAALSFKATLESAGQAVTATTDPAALSSLSSGRYACVVLFTQGDRFTDEQIDSLRQYVRGGGGLVGIHSAASTNKLSDEFVKLLGGVYADNGGVFDFEVSVSDADHPIAHRQTKFRIHDELYVLDKQADCRVFLTAWWGFKPQPMAWSREEGKGRVVYLALGHHAPAWGSADFQKILVRSVRFAAGEDWAARTVKVAGIGYGPSFGMGKHHMTSAGKARLTPMAVCDIDPKRLAAAKQELGDHIITYESVDQLLSKSDCELCLVITPHNTHAPISMQCLNAGRHVVTEKPYTCTVQEATSVIETARKARRMATVFHNRRWDGDFMTIRNLVRSGVIGDVFHIECFFGGFGEQKTDWWRSYKDISGGSFFDWGAHFVDWILQIMPHKIESISGDFKKLRWHQVTNEDFTSAYIRFEGGRSAHVEQGSIGAIGKSRWRILGTHGGIEQKGWDAKDGIHVVSYKDGPKVDSTVPCLQGDWDAFYRNVADHLILGEPLAVTPESARKVIAVLNLSEVSAKQGGAPVKLPFDQ